MSEWTVQRLDEATLKQFAAPELPDRNQ